MGARPDTVVMGKGVSHARDRFDSDGFSVAEKGDTASLVI